MRRIARYFARKVLREKGMKLCGLCDEAVIGVDETACYLCTLDATFDVEVVQ